MMREDIPRVGSEREIDCNTRDFIKSLSQEELQCHARAMFRWEIWYHAMECS
jgi:hypothetical protein